MTNPIIIHIPIAAQGKARARSGPNSHYTPQKTRDYEKTIADEAALVMRLHPILLPVRVTIRCEYAPPKSWPKWRKTALMGKGKITKPDGDNIMKAICDALNGIVWRDDAQVVEWIGVKVYGPADSITIKIEETT
jgi:Holliday junction resolvase RusA-like endonuclease